LQKGNFYLQLMNGQFKVEKNQLRFVLSLMEDVRLEAIAPWTFARAKNPSVALEKTNVHHTLGSTKVGETFIVEELVGRDILFHGVDPRVIGATPYRSTASSMAVAIVNVSALARVTGAPEIWVPASSIWGYRCTGRSIGIYKQFTKIEVVYEEHNREQVFSLWAGIELSSIQDLTPMIGIPGKYRISLEQARQTGLSLVDDSALHPGRVRITGRDVMIPQLGKHNFIFEDMKVNHIEWCEEPITPLTMGDVRVFAYSKQYYFTTCSWAKTSTGISVNCDEHDYHVSMRRMPVGLHLPSDQGGSLYIGPVCTLRM